MTKQTLGIIGVCVVVITFRVRSFKEYRKLTKLEKEKRIKDEKIKRKMLDSLMELYLKINVYDKEIEKIISKNGYYSFLDKDGNIVIKENRA